MTPRIALLLTGFGLLVCGCGHETPARPASKTELRSIDAPGLAGVLESHRGQVVLVDFWATWCKPCVELFPHTVELHRRFGDCGLAVVTLSFDDPDNRPAVRRFLAEQAATMENFLSLYGVGPAAFSAFSIDDGALPHVRLYDRQGKLRQTFTSGGRTIDPVEVDRAVKGLLE
jgi:thiol-disulfide isomerase/thioredoxin